MQRAGASLGKVTYTILKGDPIVGVLFVATVKFYLISKWVLVN
jgi:hypothetical protein